MIQDQKKARAKELQREYLREWRRKNKDKVKHYQETYWQRKADAEQKEVDG